MPKMDGLVIAKTERFNKIRKSPFSILPVHVGGSHQLLLLLVVCICQTFSEQQTPLHTDAFIVYTYGHGHGRSTWK